MCKCKKKKNYHDPACPNIFNECVFNISAKNSISTGFASESSSQHPQTLLINASQFNAVLAYLPPLPDGK